MNQTQTKTTVSNLKVGKVYQAGYISRGNDNRTANRFVGFRVNGQYFNQLKTLKQFYGVRNLRDLEFEVDRLEHGSIPCEWYDCEDEFHWAAYLWSGKFCVGSSGDALKVA